MGFGSGIQDIMEDVKSVKDVVNPPKTNAGAAADAQASQGTSVSSQSALPSYKHGTDYVPETGPAIIHKGEKVVPAEENTKESDISFHRSMHHLNKGGLHRALGIPEGQKIPAEKVSAAMKSTNSHVAAMARLAHSMAGWKH